MGFLQGLHGTIAIVALCGLLFVDETGIPLPFVPNEVLLLVAGLLIASDAISAWIFLPVAFLTMTAGMLAGYSWARAVGQTGLCALAEKVGASKSYERTLKRLSASSPMGIAVARMIPGVRPYATLISGAAEVNPRTFLLGAIPALVVWELILTGLGMLVGLPVALLLGRFEKLAVRGGLLIVLGAVAFFGLRRAARSVPAPTRWLPPRGSALLTAIVDGGVVACLVVGLLALGRRIIHTTIDGWIDLVVVAAVVAVYLIIMRNRPGATVGDALMQ